MTIPMNLLSLQIFNVDLCEPIFVHSITDYNLWQKSQTHIVPRCMKCREYYNNYFKPNNYPVKKRLQVLKH